MFEINKSYTKKDLYTLLSVPLEKQKGAWDTGYREYEGNVFIFANIGIPGRDGHDYNNYWNGDLFYWEAKTNSNINQLSIKRLISQNPEYDIHLFTRTDNRFPFTYEGNVVAKKVFDEVPIKVIWQLRNTLYSSIDNKENTLLDEPNELYEGTKRVIVVNKYERNPLARRMCIEHHGYSCKICDFNFYDTYGEIGKEFIEVHHIEPISSRGEEYKIDPINDLIPICPNCHAMIHRRDLVSVEELRNKLKK